ncbi:DoxX family protein [Rhodobacteraceae bacterium]|nr:DoxX family protein [Paracoccaceae bacterium]
MTILANEKSVDPHLAGVGILVLRAVTGALFITHGLIKLVVFTPTGTMGYFTSLGLPGWMGVATMMVELAGGIALVLGIFPRVVAALMVPVLLGAALMAHVPNGFSFSNAGGGWEYPVMWAAVMAAIALLGDGPKALLPSRILGRFIGRA